MQYFTEIPLLLPVDVTVDKKYQRLVDKGGNLLNENSSFESRLGGQQFFPKESLFSAYKNGFLTNQDVYFCLLQSCIIWLSSPDLGKFMAFCLISKGVSVYDRAHVQLYFESISCSEVALGSTSCRYSVYVRGIGHGGSGFIKVDLEGGARWEKKLPIWLAGRIALNYGIHLFPVMNS